MSVIRESRLMPIKADVIRYYEEGHSLAETGARFGVGQTTVKKFFGKHGVARRPRGEAISLYWQGASKARDVAAPDPYQLPPLPVEERQSALDFDDTTPRRQCPRCKASKSVDDFYTRDGKVYNPYCKPCWLEYNAPYEKSPKRKEYHRRYREGYRHRRFELRRQLREEVIAGYGGRCTCCGESRYQFLAFDHIDGGGCRHWQRLRGQGVSPDGLMRRLKAAGFPPLFRVLCHNCNTARGCYGYCPHQADAPPFAPEPYEHLNGVERRRARVRSENRRVRIAAIAAYGGKCACCEESRPEFMAFDHAEGDGAEHRKQLRAEGLNGQAMLRRLEMAGFPVAHGLRLLCHNCNASRGWHGYCCHPVNA